MIFLPKGIGANQSTVLVTSANATFNKLQILRKLRVHLVNLGVEVIIESIRVTIRESLFHDMKVSHVGALPDIYKV